MLASSTHPLDVVLDVENAQHREVKIAWDGLQNVKTHANARLHHCLHQIKQFLGCLKPLWEHGLHERRVSELGDQVQTVLDIVKELHRLQLHEIDQEKESIIELKVTLELLCSLVHLVVLRNW